MYTSDSKGISNKSGVFVLIGLWMAGFLVGMILTIPIWLAFGNGGLFAMSTDLLKPENATAMYWIQIISTACIFFFPAYFTAVFINKKPFSFLGLNNRFNGKQIGYAAALIFLGAIVAGSSAYIMEWIPISQGATDMFKKMEENYAAQVEALAKMNNFGEYLLALIMIAALPALFEEVFFRGAMQNLLVRSTNRIWLSIIITSIIFSVVHFSFYGFLARVILGVVLGVIYHYSRNLWLSVIAHFLNNAYAVTFMYYLVQSGKSVKEAMDDRLPIWWGLIAIIAFYFVFQLFKKISAEYLAKVTPPEVKAQEEQWIA